MCDVRLVILLTERPGEANRSHLLHLWMEFCKSWTGGTASVFYLHLPRGERQTEDLEVPGSIPGLGIIDSVYVALCRIGIKSL